MLIFNRAQSKTDRPCRIAIDPEVVHLTEEMFYTYGKDPTPYPVVKIFFRCGGFAVVEDPAREVIDGIGQAQAWGAVSHD